MKIVFTGGGSGGHFYPLIAVAEEINAIVEDRNIIKPELYYLSDSEYDNMLLYQNEIEFRRISVGKLRRYFSLENATDMIRMVTGFPAVLALMYRLYPDIVFSKGSYVSMPVCLAARILRIPVFIHDSDAVPGRANVWAGKFAARIGLSFPEAAEYFGHKERIAFVGNPIRREVRDTLTHDPHAYFQFVPTMPTVLFLGGSQGAEVLNSTVLQALPEMLNKYQIIHQVGKGNYEAFKEVLAVELRDHPHASRYRLFPSLNAFELRSAAGAANIIVSRAGTGSIYEIANWEKPSILVPIPESVSSDQRSNAYAYARTGATEVIEQDNFTSHLLLSEIERILADATLQEKMRAGARAFKRPDAARLIAEELLAMALKHEA